MRPSMHLSFELIEIDSHNSTTRYFDWLLTHEAIRNYHNFVTFINSTTDR